MLGCGGISPYLWGERMVQQTTPAGEPAGTSSTHGTHTGAAGAVEAATTALPSLSVVICAYTLDRWEDIREAVASLAAQQWPPQEILLVTDHNEELRRRAERELSGVRVLPSTQAKGLSGARNTGTAAARCEVVAFLDDDAAAEPDWTLRLLTAYRDPSVMAVGGRIKPAWDAGRPPWFPHEFDWVVGCTYAGMPAEPAPVRNVIGANMSFRRAVLDELDGFSHGLGRIGTRPLGCEETELCIRAAERRPGEVILYQPDAVVRHHVPAQRGTWAYFRSRCWSEGLSKAAVSRLAGAERATASERDYLRRTIPRGLLRGLAPGRGGQPLSTVPVLLAGVAITAAGYLTARVRGVEPVRSPGPGAAVRGSTVGAGARSARGAAEAAAGEADGGEQADADPSRRRLGGGPPGSGGGPADPPRSRTVPLLLIGLLAAAVTLWGVSLSRMNVEGLGGFGLTDRFPITFWLALVLLCAGFALAIHHPRRSPGWAAAYTVGLLLAERATSAIVYPTLLYNWAWKHVDIIDRLSANGGHLKLDNSLGDMAAYDQWAGFFAGNAALVKLLGVHDALAYARWAPFVSSLLLLVPLVLIYRVFSRDSRLVWTAVWIFYLCNWVGQDYFSPQAFAFALYLGVLAVVFRRMARPAKPGKHAAADAVHPLTGRPVGLPLLDRRQRLLWTALLTVPIAAIAASHQLTPLMLGLGLFAVALHPRYRNWPLAAVGLVLPVLWDATSALSFVTLNMKSLIAAFGNLMANSSATTGATPTGIGPVTISWFDRGLSAAAVALAVAGVLRHPALRRTAFPLVLACVVGIPMMVANNYGGEMIFRVFMFMLPMLAFFGAAAMHPRQRPVAVPGPVAEGSRYAQPVPRPSAAVTATALPVLLVLALAFFPSYYGKDAINYYPPGEVRLVETMWRLAPSGSYLVAPDNDFPDADRHYAEDGHYWFDTDTPATVKNILADPAAALAGGFEADHLGKGQVGLVLITQSEINDAELSGLLPPGSLAKIEASLSASPSFEVAAHNAYGTVFEWVPSSTAGGGAGDPGGGSAAGTSGGAGGTGAAGTGAAGTGAGTAAGGAAG